MAVQRRDKLDDSRNYQQFLTNVYEAVGWINAKHKVAADQSYMEPTNLQVGDVELNALSQEQQFQTELYIGKSKHIICVFTMAVCQKYTLSCTIW